MIASQFVADLRAALDSREPPTRTIGTRKGRFPAVLHPLLFERRLGSEMAPEGSRPSLEVARAFSDFLMRIANGELIEPHAFRRALRALPARTRASTDALFDALYAALQYAVWEQETQERLFGTTSAEEVLCIVAGLGRDVDRQVRVDHEAHVSHFLVHAAVMLGATQSMTIDQLVAVVDRRLAGWGEDPTHRIIVVHAAYNLLIEIDGVGSDDREYDIIRDGRAALRRGTDPLVVFRIWWDELGWSRADSLVRILAPDRRREFYLATREMVESGHAGEPADAAIRTGFVDERGRPHLRGRRAHDEVVLRFPGGSAIGRSCTMYEAGDRRLLFDIGGDNFGRYPHWSPELHDIDAVFVTHAHHDHIGGLLHLYNDLGFDGRWYAEPETIACTRLALEDSLRLKEDSDRLSGTARRLLERVLERAVPITAGRAEAIGNVAVTGYRAGHVIGSLQFLVESHAAGRVHRVMISGDINPASSLSVPPLALPSATLRAQVDVLVVEGTNAFRTDDPVVGGETAKDALCTLLAAQTRWPVLLPVMSLGRAQEVIGALGGTRWRVGVFGLAARMTEAMGCQIPVNVSLNASQWRNTECDDYDVLVASAGSLQGGPARFFLEDSGWDPPIIFTGYLFPGTPAHALAERYPRVRFSGHASAESWQAYCDAFPNAKRFLVHYPGPHQMAEAAGFLMPRVDRAYVVTGA